MANTGHHHMPTYDGHEASCSRPRVQLPPEPTRVSLPPAPANWVAAPPNKPYAMSHAPNVVSLDQHFPSLGSTPPQINIPVNPTLSAQYSPNTATRPHGYGFEDHLRGMILNGGVDPQRSGARQGASSQGHAANQRTSKRLNQAQRRQQATQASNGLLQPGEQRQSQNSPATAMLQGLPQPNALPHLQSASQRANQRLRPEPRCDQRGVTNMSNRANQPPYVQKQAYGRPPPQHRQLYNPASTNPQSQRHQRYPPQSSLASPEAQSGYLDLVACHEIEKAQISMKEFNEKQNLRRKLEQASRKAVHDFEIAKYQADFDIDTIELKCFGSLSTTFATKSSDMDLVLVSPFSKPATSAPESELPRIIEKALLDGGYGARLLTRTRVPIIRFCEKPTKELATLLLREREKFELERDAPPKPLKAGKTAKKAKGKGSELQSHDGIINGITGPEPEHAKSDAEKKKDITKAESGDDGPSPDKMAEQETTPDSTQSPNSSNNDSVCQVSPAKTQETEPDSHIDIPEEKVRPQAKTEGDDLSLSDKADTERIRLYRLAIQEGWYEPLERKVIQSFIQSVEKQGASDESKTQARDRLKALPNVIGRYRAPPESQLEYPKTGVGIQCDINFSNHLALHNSHLLKCYALCDPRVREMVLFVKAWSKKRKINNPYHGTLSSYGYVLMVLHYLVNIARPPVLPNLQRMPLAFEDKVSAKVTELDGYNIQFFRNEELIDTLRKNKRLLSDLNTETVGSLLRGFYHYYAQPGQMSPSGGFSWSMDALSLRTMGGIIPKQTKGWTGAKTETVELKGPGPQQTKDVRQRYLFAIEDPFETEHNIARTVVHGGIVAIRDEFRRAHRLIGYAGNIPGKGAEDLFAEAEDKENLQYRAFGPRPKNPNNSAKVGDGKAEPDKGNQKVVGKASDGKVSTNNPSNEKKAAAVEQLAKSVAAAANTVTST